MTDEVKPAKRVADMTAADMRAINNDYTLEQILQDCAMSQRTGSTSRFGYDDMRMPDSVIAELRERGFVCHNSGHRWSIDWSAE